MTEFLTDNSIYLVLIISLIIWLGLAYVMFSLDRKITRLEKNITNINSENS
ncbi:MAG: CcmD family protein [bacterium]